MRIPVKQRTDPLQRMDEGQDSSAPSVAKSKCRWSTEIGRWYRPRGVLLVAEEGLSLEQVVCKSDTDTFTAKFQIRRVIQCYVHKVKIGDRNVRGGG